MKLKHWLSGAVVIVFAGLVLSWAYLRTAKPSEYQTAPVTSGDISSTVAVTGNLNAVVTVQVESQVSGNIKALYADFNTKVKQGQVVAQIDPQPFQVRVDQATATVDSARASVASAQAGI